MQKILQNLRIRPKKDVSMQKEAYRPKEAAHYLGIGLSTFWLFVKESKIKTKKLSTRTTVVTKEELDRFLAA